MPATIHPPHADELLAPLLASLPTAAISPDPPTALLPVLSPILRQRVQLLSASSKEPWLPLLCYDISKAAKLQKVVDNERFEPHPVSGLMEVDWEEDVETRYKRIDEETLYAHLDLKDFCLSTQLVWCVNDEVGGGDGWRIGEVSTLEGEDDTWGERSIAQAEEVFESQTTAQMLNSHSRLNGTSGLLTPASDDQAEDDDDDYWNQYDSTPAPTPGPKDTAPAPPTMTSRHHEGPHTDEDTYFAQYASVQPAMDNHDPDEAQQNGHVESSLGQDEVTHELHHQLSASHSQSFTSNPDLHNSALAWSDGQEAMYVNSEMDGVEEGRVSPLAQPRPASSNGSSDDTIARLEASASAAAVRQLNEVAIKQHISTSMKSLYRLAKVSGIDRKEFARIVQTELECLALMDEDDGM